jgi:DNA-binding transcriptional regulator GbsR (MarR family)
MIEKTTEKLLEEAKQEMREAQERDFKSAAKYILQSLSEAQRNVEHYQKLLKELTFENARNYDVNCGSASLRR